MNLGNQVTNICVDNGIIRMLLLMYLFVTIRAVHAA